ncbi:MAG: zinc-dependent alcohol dehydrogenase family protein [Proteobacteria bacterium]|nr:zinc-dependent alcohol dehydrogenase family protein [Pseudomonadota bacterium]
MKAMVLKGVSSFTENPSPLAAEELPEPVPGEGEILIAVRACGVCHTELDEIEGRAPPPAFPVIPGHQVVGEITALGENTGGFSLGDRVGVGWIHWACGACDACRAGDENLCESFRATGRDVNGGYAEFMTVPAAFAHPIPAAFSDAEAAPFMCAGAIGWRSLRLAGLRDGQNLGLTGFGASAHLVLKMVRHKYPHAKTFVFARNERERAFARQLGAVWTGAIQEAPPEKLHAIIDTTPAWKPVVEALRHLAPGGRLVINAIRKEERDRTELLRLDYPVHLWLEKEIKSVANVARRDIREFLELAAEIPLRPEVEEYPLTEANRALAELREGKIRGAKVLRIA